MMLIEKDLQEIVERIVAQSDPDRIYLFGSYTRGTAHAGSDVDLLIVESSTLPRLHRGKSIKAVLYTFPCHFDLLFFTPRELADEMSNIYSFISSIMAGVQLVYQKVQDGRPCAGPALAG
jgi:predicted nucleotidyltransferase